MCRAQRPWQHPLTPLTTIAAQIALATSSASNSVSSVASAINTALGAALGGQSDIVGTPLVDVSTAGCATAASQASLDASLVLAGINQLAANNHVSSVDLIAAVVADVQSDNQFDGTANGVALTVPLSGGTVQLCTIEEIRPGGLITGLAQQLGAAVAEFQAFSGQYLRCHRVIEPAAGALKRAQFTAAGRYHVQI